MSELPGELFESGGQMCMGEGGEAVHGGGMIAEMVLLWGATTERG